MHESRVVSDILSEIKRVAALNRVDQVDVVRIEIGAMSHITPNGFSGHFELVADGTVAEGAHLDITKSKDREAPNAQSVRLVSIVSGDVQ
jgi:hydrogenase nickel incorporation protein HypA/HybF